MGGGGVSPGVVPQSAQPFLSPSLSQLNKRGGENSPVFTPLSSCLAVNQVPSATRLCCLIEGLSLTLRAAAFPPRPGDCSESVVTCRISAKEEGDQQEVLGIGSHRGCSVLKCIQDSEHTNVSMI